MDIVQRNNIGHLFYVSYRYGGLYFHIRSRFHRYTLRHGWNYWVIYLNQVISRRKRVVM